MGNRNHSISKHHKQSNQRDIAQARAGIKREQLGASQQPTQLRKSNISAESAPSIKQSSSKRASSSLSSASSALSTRVNDAGGKLLSSGRSALDFVKANPFLVGAAVMATGVVIGLVLPRTLVENTWFGKGRDQMMNKAQELARGAVEKVETVAKQVVGTAGTSVNGIAKAASRQLEPRGNA